MRAGARIDFTAFILLPPPCHCLQPWALFLRLLLAAFLLFTQEVKRKSRSPSLFQSSGPSAVRPLGSRGTSFPLDMQCFWGRCLLVSSSVLPFSNLFFQSNRSLLPRQRNPVQRGKSLLCKSWKSVCAKGALKVEVKWDINCAWALGQLCAKDRSYSRCLTETLAFQKSAVLY